MAASPLPSLAPPPQRTKLRAIARLPALHLLFLVLWSVFLTRVLNPALYHASTATVALAPSVADPDQLAAHKTREKAVRERLLSQLPQCARAGRAKSFLFVFMGHSGTTAMITSLQQHSGTYITGLEPVDHGRFLEGTARDAARRAVTEAENYFANGTAINKTVGFKIRPRHLLAAPREFSRLLQKYKTRIVWSYRTNMFKQALGDYTIHHMGDHSAYEGLKLDRDGQAKAKKRMTRFRVHDMHALHKLLKSRVNGDRLVSRALGELSMDGCVLPVSYESYLRRPEVTVERIQRFLGLGSHEIHGPLRAKATQDSICDLVENWEEVCEAFFGCEAWRWMIDDFDNGCSCASIKPSKFKVSGNLCAVQ